MPAVGYILTALAAYLLGSIPSGFLVGKSRGIDIRKTGSGNIGATNVFRALGTPAGVLVLLADVLKGWLAVAVVASLFAGWFPAATALGKEWFQVIAGLAAVLGHNFTCWLNFKGGKGIATTAGVLIALVPAALLIILAVFVVVIGLTRYVSLGSISAALTLPFAIWVTGRSFLLIAVGAGMTILAIYKHKANIQRLLKGTESRLGRKPTAAAEAAGK